MHLFGEALPAEGLEDGGFVVERVAGGVDQRYHRVGGEGLQEGGEGGIRGQFGFVTVFKLGPAVSRVGVEPFAQVAAWRYLFCPQRAGEALVRKAARP